MSSIRRKRLPSSIRIRRRWGRKVAIAVVLASAVFVALRDRRGRERSRPVAASPDRDFERYHDRSFRVVYVVDGDTLDIDAPDGDKPKTRIRLWGVDTPEVGHGRKTDMHFGPEAKRFAEETLDGRNVHVVLSELRTRGKYGRLLAYVFLERGGRMFNEVLLEEGYAYADLRFEHHYYDQFEAIEKRARRAGVGLWKDVTPDDMPPWRRRFEARQPDIP